uniref:Uncharacterized protein n=1 Tax=Vitrella brassicaformis TaxID=1169539 RepID=A0A7S1K1D3_9ALVE|mmetsp:Transcript_34120/g.84431  ORF Transcript_34120/g.84431 Transcript_34120/m.84431 type:complete len:224 (+) Transcript_34120:162-833(+)
MSAVSCLFGIPILCCIGWCVGCCIKGCVEGGNIQQQQRLASNRNDRIKPTVTKTPPQSGTWLGSYMERGVSFTTTYKLTFGVDGTVTGTGNDADGDFTVNGVYNTTTGKVSWSEKSRWRNLAVDVTGSFDAQYRSISGRYTANTGVSNTMTIRLATADPMTQPVPIPHPGMTRTEAPSPAHTALTVAPTEPDREPTIDGRSDTTAPSSFGGGQDRQPAVITRF